MGGDLVVTLGAIGLINVMGWLTPGPNMLAIISASVSNGRKSGLMTALGVSLGGVFWTLFAVTGAAVVFELFPKLVFVLRLAGAAYLTWLGVRALRSVWAGGDGSVQVYPSTLSGRAALRTGFFVIATNPKAAIFFGSIFAALVPVGAPLWLLAVIVAFSASQATIQHCITATVFSSRPVVAWFHATQRRLTAFIGTLFCGLGLSIAYDACRRY